MGPLLEGEAQRLGGKRRRVFLVPGESAGKPLNCCRVECRKFVPRASVQMLRQDRCAADGRHAAPRLKSCLGDDACLNSQMQAQAVQTCRVDRLGDDVGLVQFSGAPRIVEVIEDDGTIR